MPGSDSLNISYIERAPRRNPNVQAFNRGKEAAYAEALEFCRQGLGFLGDEILLNVRSEMKQTAESIRSEVAELVDSHQQDISDKLDALAGQMHGFTSVEKRSRSPEGRSSDKSEANRRLVLRREEQIVQIHEQLAKMSEQLNKVQKKTDMDMFMQQVAGKIDMQKMLDVQTMQVLQKVRELQQTCPPDLSLALSELQAAQAPPVDLTPIFAEVRRSQHVLQEDFQVLMQEVSKVQQHLQLDHLPMMTDQYETACAVDFESEAKDPETLVEPFDAELLETKDSDKEGKKVKVVQFDETAFRNDDEQSISLKVKKLKRVREMSAQTDKSLRDSHAQTDLDFSRHTKKSHRSAPKSKPVQPVAQLRPGLQDKDAFKERARKALLRPQYNVFDHYHTSGFCQSVARHYVFDNLTVTMVALNAVWIAIDIDYNSSAVLTQADTVFQVVEHSFCTYFFLEILIRFGAFAQKRRALVDPWFMFDAVLVLNMVVETWFVPIIILAAGSGGSDFVNISFLRMMRMVKLLRLSRISRFIRSVPELVIILKAMGFAARSVMVFFLVWLVIIYVFAVVLRQATQESEVGSVLFPSVPDAMNTLLLDGLLADYSPFIKSMGEHSPFLYVGGLAYVLLVAITVMYMLVGCLVEAVGAIASSQKEGLAISYVAGTVRTKMESLGHSPDAAISLQDFQQYLTDPEIAGILASVKVDVVILGEMLEMVYEDLERQNEAMTFEKMVELMLNGRGSNVATVRDIKELLRMIKSAVKVAGIETSKRMTEELNSMTATLQTLRDEGAESAVGSDSSDEGRVIAPRSSSTRKASHTPHGNW